MQGLSFLAQAHDYLKEKSITGITKPRDFLSNIWGVKALLQIV
jgi:hypothetical protein